MGEVIDIGMIVGIIFFSLMGVFTVWIIIDNTKVLNEGRDIKADFKKLQRDWDANPNPSPAELEQFQARLTAMQARYDNWVQSPFVIQRPR